MLSECSFPCRIILCHVISSGSPVLTVAIRHTCLPKAGTRLSLEDFSRFEHRRSFAPPWRSGAPCERIIGFVPVNKARSLGAASFTGCPSKSMPNDCAAYARSHSLVLARQHPNR